MDIYCEGIKTGITNQSNLFNVQNISLNLPSDISYLSQKYARYISYPYNLHTAIKDLKKPFIVHITDHDYSYLCNNKYPSIVTCHDLSEYVYPSLNTLRLMLWKLRIRGMKKACKIIAVSDNTARDIRKYLNIKDENIEVIYEAIPKLFRILDSDHFLNDKAQCLKTGKKNTTFLLHVGSNIPRKNIPLILYAMRILKSKKINIRLIKIGPDLKKGIYANLIKTLELSNDIIHFENLNVAELVDIYNISDIFLFPSLYEGFGRPIIEAQACGLPCVLSNSSSLPEIAGNGALFHDPRSKEQMVVCIEKILYDQNLRNKLIESGIKNVTRFDNEKHIDDLLRLYRSILGERN